MTETPITQADRDAAADWMSTKSYDWGYCGDIRQGRVSHDLVQAFARHVAAERAEMTWQPIESAPKDGTDIQAMIPGHGTDNVIAWQVDAFLNSEEETCGGWAFTTDQEPPECWTNGI